MLININKVKPRLKNMQFLELINLICLKQFDYS